MGQKPEEEQNNLMQAGLGLGGAAFAAQAGRAPAPVPMGGQLSPLAQQVAQNDAARQAAVRQAAAASRPIGSNLPVNPASPAVGSSGGTRLPSNPSVAAARQAAATSAQRAVPSLASRALPMLGQGGSAFAGGYTVGSVLDKAFDISGNIARGLFPDAPTLTREERAALGQAGAETADIPATGGGSGTQYNPYGLPAARQDDVTPLQEIGAVLGGPFRPSPAAIEAIEARTQAEPTILPAAVEEYRALGTDVPPLGGETIGAGTVLQEPSQIVSEAGVPTMQETIAGLTELTAPTAPTAPTLPEGVEPGSPQATFLAERARGELSPAQIAQAQEFAASMGTTFDPETGYSREPFLQAQAARGMGLRTDPQGRMIPAGFETRAEAFPEYERQAAAREARMDARPDFMVAQPVESRVGQQYTDAQLQDITGGGEAFQRAKALQDAGFDPVTGKRPEEQTEIEKATEQARLDLIRAQTERAMREEPAPDPEAERIARETAQARLDLINTQIEAAGKADPDKLAKVTAEADRLVAGGVLPEGARQAYILGQMGADVDEILGAGITPTTPEGAGKDSLGLGL